MKIDLEAVAQEILECVDYDIAKEDSYSGNSIRDDIEIILATLVSDVRKPIE